MQQRPTAERPPQNSGPATTNFTSPVQSFPCNGITPPHPHPVAPFPPHPGSHGTLHRPVAPFPPPPGSHGTLHRPVAPLPPPPGSHGTLHRPVAPFPPPPGSHGTLHRPVAPFPPPPGSHGTLHRPVAPFPPPPCSHGTLHPGPIPPPPPRSPRQQQPFYTLAMTHLPPTGHHRPLPHTLSPSPFYRPPQFPPPPTHTHTVPSESSGIRPRPLPLQPVPLRFPYPTTIAVACNHCGNHLVVDLSAHHLTTYHHRPPQAPHPPPARPLLWRLPIVRPPISLPPPTQTSDSASSLSLQGPSGTHLTSLPPPSPENTPVSHKPRKTSSGRKKGGAGKGVAKHSGIIPYRERKKQVSMETYARQQLEVEFAGQEKPTVQRMSELAGKLGVSREFVRQWFLHRRQRQLKRTSSEGAGLETIPSGTHEITIEVPPTDPFTLEETGVTVFVHNSPK